MPAKTTRRRRSAVTRARSICSRIESGRSATRANARVRCSSLIQYIVASPIVDEARHSACLTMVKKEPLPNGSGWMTTRTRQGRGSRSFCEVSSPIAVVDRSPSRGESSPPRAGAARRAHARDAERQCDEADAAFPPDVAEPEADEFWLTKSYATFSTSAIRNQGSSFLFS